MACRVKTGRAKRERRCFFAAWSGNHAACAARRDRRFVALEFHEFACARGTVLFYADRVDTRGQCRDIERQQRVCGVLRFYQGAGAAVDLYEGLRLGLCGQIYVERCPRRVRIDEQRLLACGVYVDTDYLAIAYCAAGVDGL